MASMKTTMAGFLHDPFEPIAWLLGVWVVVGYTVLLVNVTASFAWSRWPPNRFYALADEARQLCTLIELHAKDLGGTWGITDPGTRERLLTFKSRMDDLQVPTPSTVDFDPLDWYRWLPKVASWAETRNLHEARKFEPEPRKGMGSSHE